ncbi:VanZ family protein [Thalassotalea maritima]|uniref:VanZ family protein n=1 Tax=Thalassotalea maritima TaxID=3242416 RepID=UPI003526F399
MILLLRIIDKYWYWVTFLIMALIALLSLYPLDSLPPVPGSDKTHHFIAYAALAFPVALSKPKSWWYVIVAIIAFGGIIELIQPYVNRYGEWADMSANSLGVLVGIILATAMKAIFKYQHGSKVNSKVK